MGERNDFAGPEQERGIEPAAGEPDAVDLPEGEDEPSRATVPEDPARPSRRVLPDELPAESRRGAGADEAGGSMADTMRTPPASEDGMEDVEPEGPQ